MPKRTTDYRSALLEDLRNPMEAAYYLNAALHDSEEAFLLALRDVAEARQMAKIAENVGVSRESLYRMLTASGNPTYRNFFGVLRALGVEFGDIRVRPESRPSPPVPAFQGATATGSSTGKRRPKHTRTPAKRRAAMRPHSLSKERMEAPIPYSSGIVRQLFPSQYAAA
jgi:probable addiction module antidote protein